MGPPKSSMEVTDRTGSRTEPRARTCAPLRQQSVDYIYQLSFDGGQRLKNDAPTEPSRVTVTNQTTQLGPEMGLVLAGCAGRDTEWAPN